MTYVNRQDGKVGLQVGMSPEEFDNNKVKLADMMRKAGVDSQRINDYLNNVNNGAELEKVRQIFNMISGGRMHNPQKPPEGSVVRLPQHEQRERYQSVREGINDLYRKVAKGDQEANQQLNKLWQKAVDSLKNDYGKYQFSGSGCPKCGSLIITGSDVCPACNFDIAKFKRDGGEFA